MATKKDKVYKAAVKTMTAEVRRLNSGGWSGTAAGPAILPSSQVQVSLKKRK